MVDRFAAEARQAIRVLLGKVCWQILLQNNLPSRVGSNNSNRMEIDELFYCFVCK